MTSRQPGPGPHRTDPLSLIFGAIFLLAAGAWATGHYIDLPWRLDWSLPGAGWLAAGALVLVGLLGVLASLRRQAPSGGTATGVDATATEPERHDAGQPDDADRR